MTSNWVGLLAQAGGADDPMAAIAAAAGTFGLIGAVVGILLIVAMWKIFTKAGKPGWASLVPIYNLIVLLEIVGRPTWWILLFLCLGPIAGIIVSFDLAKSFGKGAGFGLGLAFLFPIFGLVLAFGDAKYIGPKAQA